MPVQKAKSGLMAKYGNKLDSVTQKHADDETDYGFVRLPGGISNGVAKLVDCKFDVYKTGANKGEYFFRAAGVVLEPESVITATGEMKVRGLQTSIMHAVCDTKKSDGIIVTQEEHIADILNEMRKLAGSEFTQGATGADLEGLAAALKEAGPYFRFSTSQSAPTEQYPDPRVWENWNGSKGLEDYVPPDQEGAVQDDTPDTNGQAQRDARGGLKERRGSHQSGLKAGSRTVTEAPEEKEPEEEFNEFAGEEAEQEPASDEAPDLNTLAEQADADDEPSQKLLMEMAVEAGIPSPKINSAKNWAAVAAMIAKLQPAEEEAQDEVADEPVEEDAPEEEEEEAPKKSFKPLKGDVYLYAPVDPKTKKPAKKPVEVEVVAVNSQMATVSLKNLDNPKLIYKEVNWSALKEIS